MGECRSPYCKDGKIFLYPDYEWVDCPECYEDNQVREDAEVRVEITTCTT